MRYDKLFERLVNRALTQTEADLRFFWENAVAEKVPPEVLAERLNSDLQGDGPIFGKFMRSLGGAASHATVEARRQGTRAGYAQDRKDLNDLLTLGGMDVGAAIDGADPQALEEIEGEIAPLVELTWVCDLKNTCEYCLPLHGVTRTAEEWDRLGLDPATIHADKSWNSVCYCNKFAAETIDTGEILAPLKRVNAGKGTKRTVRSIAQADLERSMAAVEKARGSVRGRRLMRILGQTNKE